jgi:hypothetical protein
MRQLGVIPPAQMAVIWPEEKFRSLLRHFGSIRLGS